MVAMVMSEVPQSSMDVIVLKIGTIRVVVILISASSGSYFYCHNPQHWGALSSPCPLRKAWFERWRS